MTQDYSFIGAKINVLNSANRILNSNNVIDEDGENSHQKLISPLLNKAVQIGLMGGLIDKKDHFSLQRMIFRAMRGKATVHIQDVPAFESDELVDFSKYQIFVVIYHHGDYTYRCLRKLCESFSAFKVIDINQ